MTARTLRCPSCGWDGSEGGLHDDSFRYLEEVTNIRRVEGFNAHGVLEVSGEDHIDLEDCGANQRLLCGNCLTEFPIPADVSIDFV